MKIDGNSWHVKVYKWWYDNKYKNPAAEYICPPPPKTHSNLCPYMRAVMFWAPLRAIFWNWIKIGPLPINAVTLPAFFVSLPFLVGYVDYTAKMVVFCSYLVILVLSVLFTLVWLISVKNILEPVERKIDNIGFVKLAQEYLRSAHDRVCPEVFWE